MSETNTPNDSQVISTHDQAQENYDSNDFQNESQESLVTIDVDATLRKGKEQFKSTKVSKDDDLTYDLGNLATFDYHPVDIERLHREGRLFLEAYCRDNVQLLFNHIFRLPSKINETHNVLAKLPKTTTLLPREKPIPKPKPLTRWQKFAEAKGIMKRKRPQRVWDENTGEWRRSWGLRRANDPKDVWLVEAKPDDEVGTDPFIKQKKEKKERVTKQRKQQLRNIREADKSDLKRLGPILDVEREKSLHKIKKKKELDKTVNFANKSTASLGKFDEKLPGQKPLKVREKFKPVSSSRGDKNEKTKSLDVLKRILNKKEKAAPINTVKAVKKHTATEKQKAYVESLSKPSVPFKKRGQRSTKRTPSKRKVKAFNKFANN